MTNRALVRGSIAVAAACSIISGPAHAAVQASPADTPTETVIPADLQYPPQDLVAFAGPSGFLHDNNSRQGYVWTPYSGGSDVPVPGQYSSVPGSAGAGADVVALTTTGNIQLENMDTGVKTTIQQTAGAYTGTFGSTVLTRSGSGSTFALQLVSASGGQQTVTPVTGWPAGATFGGPMAGDAQSVVLAYKDSAGEHLALLDLATAHITPIFGTLPAQTSFNVILTAKYIAWYAAQASMPVVHLLTRATPGGPETTLQVPGAPVPGVFPPPQQGVRLGIVGDSLLLDYSLSHFGDKTADDFYGYPLYAMPLAGGNLTTVLNHVGPSMLQSGADGAMVIGGSSLTDYGARRLTAAPDGTVTATAVDSDPGGPVPVEGLAMADGQLVTLENRDIYTRTVQFGGTPSYGARSGLGLAPDSSCDSAATCSPPLATGDGRIAQLNPSASGDSVVVEGSAGSSVVQPGPVGGRLVDSDGRYVIYDNPSTGKQYIGDTALNTSTDVLFTRSITGAALSESTLWAAGPTPGSISAIDLPTQATTRTIATGAPCTPSELQAAAGRWIYWSCGTSGPAGVYDLVNGTDISVPSAGPAQLGDGYLVEHDMSAGKLELTDFHNGTAVTSDLAALPAGPVPDDRRVTWAVDAYDGGIAYVDAQQNVHVVDPHIPASPPSGTDMLPGQHLSPGESLTSGSMRLVMQADGNLVAYLAAGGGATTAEWSSGTWGHPGAYAVMQSDGNLVVYGPGGGPSTGGALWSSGTSGNPGAHAVLQDDGNFVVYRAAAGDPADALWASGSSARPQTIGSGTVLHSGWWTQGQYTFLVMQPDGNLVMYRKRDGAAIWSSGTWGHPGAYAVMQNDGNLVVYRQGGAAIWSSGTWGHPGAYAVMQNDGNLVVYRQGGGALWATGTWRTSR